MRNKVRVSEWRRSEAASLTARLERKLRLIIFPSWEQRELMLAFTFLAAILLSNKNFMKLAGTQFYFSINKSPENTAFSFWTWLKIKLLLSLFMPQLQYLLASFQMCLPMFLLLFCCFFKSWLCCFCSLHKKELMQKCFSHLVRSFEEKPKALTCAFESFLSCDFVP